MTLELDYKLRCVYNCTYGYMYMYVSLETLDMYSACRYMFGCKHAL